ncbi:hypothetical protein WOLCODRAFT_17394 [Wolfiporia cocos MD-104 SS10]|uniref:Uncharacterized protein n=1 Tax=Wolfiporia cocos (strain MD-104) TaxID=742152 RepID=A0A2H3JPU8_WOLCO|nr:hypothetical protein WOLCODRAFT_17394 [Wolfiporia cocos MD-104 SS10]
MPKDTETSQRSQVAPEPYRKQIIYQKYSIRPGPTLSFPPQSSGPFVLNACPDGNEVVEFSLNRGLTANAADDPAPSSLSQSSSRTNLAEFFDSDETILDAADARALDATYDASSSRYYLGAGSGYLERMASPSLHSPESTRRLIKVADIDCPLIHVGNSNEGSDSDSETGAENSEGLDLTDNPLYASQEAIFDDILGNTTQGSVDMPVLGDLPPAFYKDKLIRNAYIDAYIAASTHHATHELVKHILDGYYQTFIAISACTGLELEGLQNMARTLRTVERRLGIDPDQLIQYHFVCDVCWYCHSPSELYELDTPACTQADCSGTLYTTKQLSDGRIKHTPVKIFPTMPIKVALQHLLLRPSRYKEFQHWQDEGDEPCCVPPSHVRGLDAFPELTTPMCDIYDGWGWRTIQAGLERRQTGQWGVADVDVLQIHQRFKSKKSPHSTGAIYISICNTPRAKRFLHDETIPCCVIPGPKEPSLEQLNYVLDPFVLDVNELQNGPIRDAHLTLVANILTAGLMFNVHDQDEPKLCHGTLYLNVSDLLASRKATGLRGVTSMGFTCSYCYQTLDALVSPTCYDSNGKTKHLFQEILVGNAMFHKRSRIDKPAAKLEAFLASVWWPSTSGRIPEKLVEGSSQVKADQWRNLVTILPVALYCAWEVDRMIPNSEAPRPALSSITEEENGRRRRTIPAASNTWISRPPDYRTEEIEKLLTKLDEHVFNAHNTNQRRKQGNLHRNRVRGPVATKDELPKTSNADSACIPRDKINSKWISAHPQYAQASIRIANEEGALMAEEGNLNEGAEYGENQSNGYSTEDENQDDKLSARESDDSSSDAEGVEAEQGTQRFWTIEEWPEHMGPPGDLAEELDDEVPEGMQSTCGGSVERGWTEETIDYSLDNP